MPRTRFGKPRETPRKSRRAKVASSRAAVISPGARRDLIGVFVCIIAIALGVSLVSPSAALVTHACSQGLTLGFGSGAMLVPASFFLFGLTFFVSGETPVSMRVALGLILIVLSILAMLSLNAAGAESSPEVLFTRPVLTTCGGYAGSGIAWTLITFLGKTVGMVILAGICIAGIIVCGFSISRVVAWTRMRFEALAEKRETRRIERKQQLEARKKRKQILGNDRITQSMRSSKRVHPVIPPQTPLYDEDGKPITTSIDVQKTSVLASEKDKTVPLKKEKTLAKKSKNAKNFDSVQRPGEAYSSDLTLPPLSTLRSNPHSASSASSTSELERTAEQLQTTLFEFGLASQVTGWVSGPLVTTFKVAMGEGERVNKITNLEGDIALSLAAESVRIFSPIPNTSLVGIEIPNKKRQNICLGDVLPFAQGRPLELAIGRDSEGAPVVTDLAGMPHLLIAGATGSGKSVMINSIIMSLLMRTTPEQVRLIMIDPKRVELGGYNGLPHLYVPVVTEPRQAASALQWAVSEMDRRLKVFERVGAREIVAYNAIVKDETTSHTGRKKDADNEGSKKEHMPYLVIIIDELSDLMMVAGKDVEASIVRIAQLARAAGIHLIVATQRPSADVVTGLIKSNIENRIAFSVASGTDSRVILDQTGAERLLGRGDMLFKHRGMRTRRVLGCYVSDSEITEAVGFIKRQGEPSYHDEILSAVVPGKMSGGLSSASDDDPLVWDAAQIVVDSQVGSTSGLQRHLKVGYARAGRIMDMLEQKGIVGPPDGSKPRDVLLDAQGLVDLKSAEAACEEDKSDKTKVQSNATR